MKNATKDTRKMSTPQSLKNWFVAHFLVDMVFAIPMMLAPTAFLKMFGWQTVDPVLTRVGAAALLGIGIESYLGRDAGVEQYRGMLNLKIIWSSSALAGIGISLLQGAQGSPPAGWMIWGIFLLFDLVWIYYRMKLGAIKGKAAKPE